MPVGGSNLTGMWGYIEAFRELLDQVNTYILYFAWEDQGDATYCIVHRVLINCITVLYTHTVQLCS